MSAEDLLAACELLICRPWPPLCVTGWQDLHPGHENCVKWDEASSALAPDKVVEVVLSLQVEIALLRGQVSDLNRLLDRAQPDCGGL